MSEALRESSYPFLAVIVLRQNRMVVVGRREEYIAPADLLNWLENVVRQELFRDYYIYACYILFFVNLFSELKS